MSTAYRGRFAPSPTGDLHLGSAAAALVAWCAAREAGGTFVVRIEDLDRPRLVAGAEERQLADLRWLGLDWDEGPDKGGASGPYRQSERAAAYAAALADLRTRGLVYPCDCSRREIAALVSAPHPGEDGPRYPGTCRASEPTRTWRRQPAWRFRVESGVTVVEDKLLGRFEQDVEARVGDFVVIRADAVPAYQLAVVVDDLAMRISEVVRGADLLDSTPRQILLARALDGTVPRHAHLPLVLAADGTRLAKREGGATIAELRAAGLSAPQLVGQLAAMLGLVTVEEGRAGLLPFELLGAGRLDRLAGQREVRWRPGQGIAD